MRYGILRERLVCTTLVLLASLFANTTTEYYEVPLFLSHNGYCDDSDFDRKSNLFST